MAQALIEANLIEEAVMDETAIEEVEAVRATAAKAPRPSKRMRRKKAVAALPVGEDEESYCEEDGVDVVRSLRRSPVVQTTVR